MKNEISSRGLALMVSVSIFTFKLTYFPALIFNYAGRDGILSCILLIIADLISFGLVITVFLKNPNISFSEFLEQRIGKIASKIIYFLIFLFFLAKLIFLSSAGYYFARESVFQEAPYSLFIFVLFVVINAMVLFNLKSFSRTLELCYPIIIVSLFICVALGLTTTPLEGITPLFQTDANAIFDGVWNGVFCFGDYLFLLPLMGKVKIDNKFKKRLFTYMAVAIALLLAFFYCFYSAFRYTGFLHQYAITDIVEFVPLSAIIENLDLFPVSLMLLLYLFHGALFLFCMVISAKEIFKFKKKRYDIRWALLAVNIVSLILIIYVFASFDYLLFFEQKYVVWLDIVCIFLIPLICLIVSFRKIDVKNSVEEWTIKLKNEDLKWISAPTEIKKKLGLTKKFRVKGQKI